MLCRAHHSTDHDDCYDHDHEFPKCVDEKCSAYHRTRRTANSDGESRHHNRCYTYNKHIVRATTLIAEAKPERRPEDNKNRLEWRAGCDNSKAEVNQLLISCCHPFAARRRAICIRVLRSRLPKVIVLCEEMLRLLAARTG